VYPFKVCLEGRIVSLGESSGSPLVSRNLQPPESFQEMFRHGKWWADPGFTCSFLLIQPSPDWSSSDARNILQAAASLIAYRTNECKGSRGAYADSWRWKWEVQRPEKPCVEESPELRIQISAQCCLCDHSERHLGESHHSTWMPRTHYSLNVVSFITPLRLGTLTQLLLCHTL